MSTGFKICLLVQLLPILNGKKIVGQRFNLLIGKILVDKAMEDGTGIKRISLYYKCTIQNENVPCLPIVGFQNESHCGIDEDGAERASHRRQGGELVLLVLGRPPEITIFFPVNIIP